MCEFCDNIKDREQYEKTNFLDRVDCIVKDKDCYYYWSECSDYYYSGIGIELHYCPVCGRKLN